MNIETSTKQQFILLGKHLKALRIERNISLSELSDLTGIREPYLQKIEEGSAYRVSISKHLQKIAKVFNIELYKLFDF